MLESLAPKFHKLLIATNTNFAKVFSLQGSQLIVYRGIIISTGYFLLLSHIFNSPPPYPFSLSISPYLHHHLALSFSFGASILVDSQTTAFDQLAFNPQCFAVYEDPSTPPGQWNNVCIIRSCMNLLLKFNIRMPYRCQYHFRGIGLSWAHRC